MLLTITVAGFFVGGAVAASLEVLEFAVGLRAVLRDGRPAAAAGASDPPPDGAPAEVAAPLPG